MTKEKETKATTGTDTKKPVRKKKEGSNILSIFTVGVIVGLAAGFFLGWWYPAPSHVRTDIDNTKATTHDKVRDIAKQARQKTADMLEERAKHLRQPLGHVTRDEHAQPASLNTTSQSSVPTQ